MLHFAALRFICFLRKKNSADPFKACSDVGFQLFTDSPEYADTIGIQGFFIHCKGIYIRRFNQKQFYIRKNNTVFYLIVFSENLKEVVPNIQNLKQAGFPIRRIGVTLK